MVVTREEEESEMRLKRIATSLQEESTSTYSVSMCFKRQEPRSDRSCPAAWPDPILSHTDQSMHRRYLAGRRWRPMIHPMFNNEMLKGSMPARISGTLPTTRPACEGQHSFYYHHRHQLLGDGRGKPGYQKCFLVVYGPYTRFPNSAINVESNAGRDRTPWIHDVH